MLKRKIAELIEQHLKSDSERILLIDGARQVGKTYIIRHVGKKLFPNFIEINMLEDSVGERLFENAKTVDDFYLRVSSVKGELMGKAEDTLIFIDEIQAYPHLLPIASTSGAYSPSGSQMRISSSVFSMRKVISSLAEKLLPEPGTPSRNADWFRRFALLHMMRL